MKYKNKWNKELLGSGVFFIAGGALLLSPGIFPFFLTTTSWTTLYLVFFLGSVYLGIQSLRKKSLTNNSKLSPFFLSTIPTILAFTLVLVSSVFFILSIVALFIITL